ncbi:MAG: cation diffusion facilitator family transporter [Candidatus Kapabacteria bacterium]|nr:cation diffusion facilitator family transporter [Candidatus Kapabacteria bacterium]
MEHSHNHSSENASKNIGIAFFLNIFFAVFELIGGFYTNSIAIISDAAHDFGDSISLAVSWYLQKKSRQKGDKYYSYGYKRFSLLGAVVVSIILLISSIFIIQESIDRLVNPQDANAGGMLLFAIFGILANGIAVLRLKKGTTLNEKAVFLHLLEDVMGWIAVLIVSIVMMFVNLPILDPILSLAITIWVLSNVYKNLKSIIKVVLQEVPQNINLAELESRILNKKFVKSMHDVHLWSLDGEKNIMSLHIVVDNLTSKTQLFELKSDIKKIANDFGIQHLTIEIEDESDAENCQYVNGCD